MSQRLRFALSGVSDLTTLAANIGSMAILALSGAALNLLVGRFYGFEGLGIFSLALTFFLILGQVTAGGFAFATLYHFSQTGAANPEARAYLIAMSLPACLVGMVLAILLWHTGPMIGYAFGSDALGQALPAVGIAVLLFGLNKIWASALNGMQHLKTYSIFQGMRMPLMLMMFLLLVARNTDITQIGWVFAYTESLLFIGFVATLLAFTKRGSIAPKTILLFIRTDSARGWRGAFIGILADANTKIDLLVLSLISTDAAVGIYALGGLFADGVRMVLAAVQNITNPRMSQLIVAGDRVGYDELWHNLAWVGRLGAALIVLLSIAFLLLAVPSIMQVDNFILSTWVFAIVGTSIVVAAPAVILNQTFTQAGKPEMQTAYFVAIAGANLCLNFILVPAFGPLGAAAATAVAEAVQLWLLLRWLPKLFDQIHT